MLARPARSEQQVVVMGRSGCPGAARPSMAVCLRQNSLDAEQCRTSCTPLTSSGRAGCASDAGMGVRRAAAWANERREPCSQCISSRSRAARPPSPPPSGPASPSLARSDLETAAVDPAPPPGQKDPETERSAAWLAHQSGGLGVASSNLAAPTIKLSG
jgi:hypothetical protein